MKRLIYVWNFSFALLVMIHSPFLGFTQEFNWKVVPNDNDKEQSRISGMDLESYFLLVEVFNAIDSLDSRPDAPFLSDLERIAMHRIRLEFGHHTFLQTEALMKGVLPDNDALYAMAASRSKEWLNSSAKLLGPKMATVVQRVNQQRFVDVSSGESVFASEEIGKLLELNPGQREQLAELRNKFIAEKEKSAKALAKSIDELSLRYRKLMLEKLDADNRTWYTEAFGNWMKLLDESGNPQFGHLVDHYDFGEPNPSLETVSSFVRPLSGQADRPATGEEAANVRRTIKMDAIIAALLRSEKIRKELNLSERQIEELDQYFSGATLSLSNEDRDRRLRQLISLENTDNPAYQSSWSTEQKRRFSQLELQVRTSGNWSSFGILDDEVSRRMRLSLETRVAVRDLRDDFVYELQTLIADHRETAEANFREFNKVAFALLDPKQQSTFMEYFGTDYFSK